MNRKKQVDIDKVRALYVEGWTLSAIGGSFGVHAQTILNRMEESGIERRPGGVKGRKFSEEHKKKIAEALSRKPLSAERRKKISEATKGRLSWNTGLRKAIDPKMAKTGNNGSAHWAWKGGISGENVRLRQTSEYKVWREAVFARDNFTCVDCNVRGGVLNADHIKPFSTHPELRFALSNGETVCRSCHSVRTKRQWNEGVLLRPKG